MKNLLYLLIFISFSSFSQDYGNNQDAVKLCNALNGNNFSSDSSADSALDKILGVIGASKRFVLRPCDNIPNAAAISFNGIRYIYYNREFMSTINNGENWGNLFILAHEVGHHINGHSVDALLYKTAGNKTLYQRRKQELESDEFAGFILAKLGVSYQVAYNVISNISNNSDDSYSTHPTRDKRLNAVMDGYKRADYKATTRKSPKKVNNTVSSKKYPNKTASGIAAKYDVYWARASSLSRSNNYEGAIKVYNSILKLQLSKEDASYIYEARGSVKKDIEDYNGAITDYTFALDLNPEYTMVYQARAEVKLLLQDLKGACADWTLASEGDPSNYGTGRSSRQSLKKYCN